MKAETKFNPLDEVWTIIENKAKKCPISDIEVKFDSKKDITIRYYLNKGTKEDYKCTIVEENFLFKTKDELLKSL